MMAIDSTVRLKPETRNLLQLGDAERIAYIRKKHWIGYGRAKRILATMEDFLTMPRSHRMPGLLITGDSNNGKSMIVNRFAETHPSRETPRGDSMDIPVLLVETPPTADPLLLLNDILAKLFVPHRTTDKLAKRLPQVVEVMINLNIGVFILDEINNALAGQRLQQSQFLNCLRYIANKTRIPMVVTGIQEAARVLSTDPQLANRFMPEPLPRWKLDTDFLRLLKSFESTLPLQKPSDLPSRELAPLLHAMSEGIIGEADEVIRRAAIEAIRTKTEEITEDILRSLNWTPPSRRRSAAEGRN